MKAWSVASSYSLLTISTTILLATMVTEVVRKATGPRRLLPAVKVRGAWCGAGEVTCS